MSHDAGVSRATQPGKTVNIVLTQDFFPQIGGAHQWLYETYRRWPSPVTLLTRKYEANAEERAAAAQFDAAEHGELKVVRADIEIGAINLGDRHCWSRFWSITRQVQRLAGSLPRTVHCLRAFPEGFAGLLCKLRRPFTTRLVVYAHGEEILVACSSGQLRLMAQSVYRFADLVIANSRNTERLVKELCPSARVVCVHPGVDVSRYQRDVTQVARYRQHWGWPDGTIVISTVARMEPRKNQLAVLNAIATLRQSGLQLAYVCGGIGEMREALMQQAITLRLGDWVKFPGALSEDDKVLTFAASDIHVMPSIQHGEMIEGFGIVFLEAAAAGLPSICGNIGGQPEAVLDGITGIVVDGANPDQVRDAIAQLAVDANKRRRLGSAAAQRVQDYDWRMVAARTVGMFNEHVR